MDPQLKERLVGAAVLVVAGILFIPQLLDGPDERPAVTVGLELPAPDDDGRRTHTIRLDVPAERPATKSTGSIIRSSPDADVPPPPAPEPSPPPPSAAAATPKDDTAAKPAAQAPAPTPEAVKGAAPPGEPPAASSEPTSPTPVSRAPAPASPAPASAPAAGDWAVQVGSFSSEDNARRLQSRLNSAGFETFQARLVTDSGTMHRVRVGPVDDRPAAESLAARLGKAGYPGRVVQVDD